VPDRVGADRRHYLRLTAYSKEASVAVCLWLSTRPNPASVQVGKLFVGVRASRAGVEVMMLLVAGI
jgi:hypothetical protein